MKIKTLLISLVLGLGLTITLLLLLGSRLTVLAAPTAELHVCHSGCSYSSVQDAVDAASSGDVIKVTEGTYTGVQMRASITQVVYISKTVTVRGGYTTTDWNNSDPANYPTTVDAQGLGWGLVISGAITSTVEGLHITGGDATGLGGSPWAEDTGGGMYVNVATVTIRDCKIISNTTSTSSRGHGGGVSLWFSNATLENNLVQGNIASTAADGFGGGLHLYNSNAMLQGNLVQNNIVSTANMGSGGGLRIQNSAVIFENNTIQANTASTINTGYGGGVSLSGSNITFTNSTVRGNIASITSSGYGGGLDLYDSVATLQSNTIISNSTSLNPLAPGDGGGARFALCNPITLTNNLVVDNYARTGGGGLWVSGWSSELSTGHLQHNTFANNSGGQGQGVLADIYTNLFFTNTIVAGHSYAGIWVRNSSTVTLEATLWFSNTFDTTKSGGEIFTGTINVYDDPAFVNPSTWDYHLGSGSAAIDAGVDAGVTTDIDGDSRPQNVNYDLGADEAVCVTDVAVSGPITGITGNNYDFTAAIFPAAALVPVTYTWQANDQTTVVDSSNHTHTVSFDWSTGGMKNFTVTTEDFCGENTGTHTIDICLPVNSVTINGPTTGATGTEYQFSATVSPSGASTPLTYIWTPEPVSGQGSATAHYSWATPGDKNVSVTVSNCSGASNANENHTINIVTIHKIFLPEIMRP